MSNSILKDSIPITASYTVFSTVHSLRFPNATVCSLRFAGYGSLALRFARYGLLAGPYGFLPGSVKSSMDPIGLN